MIVIIGMIPQRLALRSLLRERMLLSQDRRADSIEGFMVATVLLEEIIDFLQ
jgi:hypothetical protein